MALNTFKCKHLTPLHFNELIELLRDSVYRCYARERS